MGKKNSAPPRRSSRRRASLSLSRLPPASQALLGALLDLLGESGDGFLVGGAVRDLLLAREPVDELDVALPSGALEVGRQLAGRSGGAFVLLDAQRGAARVVLGSAQAPRQIDLVDFRAESLESDLRGRDFTVNAIAVSLRSLLQRGRAPLVDPTSGLDDLRRRRLRLADPGALDDDPLRILRAVRLGFQLRFTLAQPLRDAIRKSAPRLFAVAAERVRDEMVGVLGLPRAGQALRELDRLGALGVILPELNPMKAVAQPRPHRFTVWEHSLRAVESLETLFGNLALLDPHSARLSEHLAEPLGGGLTRREVLKLAALLHDVAKPRTRTVEKGRVRFIGHDLSGASIARTIGQRLRLSGRATQVLERLVLHHLRLMHLGQLPVVSRRARYRFFRDLEGEAQDLLLLSLADAAAVRGVSPAEVWRAPASRLIAELLGGWKEDQALVSETSLLRGEDVMAAFGLEPGPPVGRLLALAREAQALRLVSDRAEALDYLRRFKDAIDHGGPGA